MRIIFDQTKVDAVFVCGREQRGEANANALTQAAFDPISREPNYKQAAVRVEKTR